MTYEENDKKDDEHARKAEEQDDKEDARKAMEHEEEDKALKADEEKEKKVDEIAKLKAEIDDLKKDQESAKREAKAKPIVDKIVTAKVKLNLIKDSDVDKEFESLITLPYDQLVSIGSQYANVNVNSTYSVLSIKQA